MTKSGRRTQADEGPARLDVTPSMHERAVRSAKRLRAEATPSEQRLWAALRDRKLNGRKFRRQQPMGPFVLDFWCAEERLAVEVDGGVHDDAAQIVADKSRRQAIKSVDIRVIRIRSGRVLNDLAGALHMIENAFQKK